MSLHSQNGEIITVTEPIAGDWCKGKLNDRTGIFPSNYIEEIPKDKVEEVRKQHEIEEQQRQRREMVDWMLKEQREAWLRKLTKEQGKSPEAVNVPEQESSGEREAAIAQLQGMGF